MYMADYLLINLFIYPNYSSHGNNQYDEFDSPLSNIHSLREVKNK